MKRILILGAGTAGTMAAVKLRKQLGAEWDITIVDEDEMHHYQPGYLFIPFGVYEAKDIIKPKRSLLPTGVTYVSESIERLDPAEQLVTLADGSELGYDYLIIATGTHPVPEETQGLVSDAYGTTVHDFYTLEGAVALHEALDTFTSGTLAINILEMPIKCPVAPLEFAFLADAYLTDKGVRDDVSIVYVTPLDSAFTKPVAAEHLGTMFSERDIAIEPDFYVEYVDPDTQRLVSYDERVVEYDLLVTVPLNMGASFVAEAGLGDEMRHVNVDHATLLSTDSDRIFAIGDAANLPTSKAGSVVHFAMESFIPNFLNHIEGRPMAESFDGHANCFVETGNGKGMLIDFDYTTEPLPGRYPTSRFGPFKLLGESRLNHWGKLLFKTIYWRVLLRGRELPLPRRTPRTEVTTKKP